LLDEIHKKLDTETYDDGFARLQAMIEALGQGTGQKIEIAAPVKRNSGPAVSQKMID